MDNLDLLLRLQIPPVPPGATGLASAFSDLYWKGRDEGPPFNTSEPQIRVLRGNGPGAADQLALRAGGRARRS